MIKMVNKQIETEEEYKVLLNNRVYEDVRKVLLKYIDTNKENIQILTLWLLGTHFHDQFETFPLLQLNAQKRSGKTRTLKLLSTLAKGSDGSVSTSATETLLFRHTGGALFFDEMESINSKERNAFRETLNAVYKKGNKIVRFKEKNNDWVEDNFYPYYPIGLANINGLGDVLADRAIQVILTRSNKDLTKLIEDFRTNEEIIKLRIKLQKIYVDIPGNFLSKWNEFVQGKLGPYKLKPLFEKIHNTKIYGRSLEIFFPLLVIAYFCDEIDSFLETAKDYVKRKEEDELIEDIDERIKVFISKAFENNKEFFFVSDILRAFKGSIEEKEDYMNSKWFGRALKRLDLVERKRMVNGRTQVILKTNSTNNTYYTNTTNSTNSTSELVENVELVDKKGIVDNYFTPKEIKESGLDPVLVTKTIEEIKGGDRYPSFDQ